LQQNEPVTQDLSRGASFKVKISPNLLEFTFKVVPHVEKADEYGNPNSTIEEVQVFRGNTAKPVQSLDGCELEDMEAPPKGSEWFRVEDINFDGYKDIYILTHWGATGNQSGCVWLYNPASGSFDFSKAFSELGTVTLHPETKTITTLGNGGMAGMVFRAATYAVENNTPVPIIEVAQDWDLDREQYHCVVKQRREPEAALLTVRDQWMKPGKNDEGPCDPADPFRRISHR
jgi:hypothetical protein